jgi:hypothetical protein
MLEGRTRRKTPLILSALSEQFGGELARGLGDDQASGHARDLVDPLWRRQSA